MGDDDIGTFRITGSYDQAGSSVTWIKTYFGAHSVHYRGFHECGKIWGTWSIRLSRNGGFMIWPETSENLTQQEVQCSKPFQLDVVSPGQHLAREEIKFTRRG